ncbi:MAG: metal-sensitive transcriptional regulator, partial [Firmicutes bacterium]|nr:metal-sensitive transcriptional regulator [Bacillota bacterium]
MIIFRLGIAFSLHNLPKGQRKPQFDTGSRKSYDQFKKGDSLVRSQEKDNVLQRLKRIEGQVRGLQRMVEEDEACVDILTQ